MSANQTNDTPLDFQKTGATGIIPAARWHAPAKPLPKLKANMNMKKRTPRSSGDPSGKLTEIYGSVPNLNQDLLQALDPETGLLYLYGGERPGSIAADFHVLDTRPSPMECLNLSEHLSERTFNGWTNGLQMTKRGLPVRKRPAFIFINMDGSKFLILYGGYARLTQGIYDGQPLSNLIVINVDDLSKPYWWVDEIEGKSVHPRLEPKIFFLDNKLYFFGGSKTNAVPEDEPEQNYYSIAEFFRADERNVWRWTASDVPYPNSVPQNRIFVNGVPISGGIYILFILTPARNQSPGNALFANSIWLFDTEAHSFHRVEAGDQTWISRRICADYVFTLLPPPKDDPQAVGSPNATSGSRHSNVHPYSSKSRRPSHPSREAVVLCEWVPGSTVSVPELCRLSPLTREFMRHKIGEGILGRSLMRRFVVVGHKMFLLGDKTRVRDHDQAQPGMFKDRISHLNAYIELSPSIWSSV